MLAYINVLLLAPKNRSIGFIKNSRAIKGVVAVIIDNVMAFPTASSALSLFPLPLCIETMVDVPIAISCENAVTNIRIGKHTPMPDNASEPIPGIFPIKILSTIA